MLDRQHERNEDRTREAASEPLVSVHARLGVQMRPRGSYTTRGNSEPELLGGREAVEVAHRMRRGWQTETGQGVCSGMRRAMREDRSTALTWRRQRGAPHVADEETGSGNQ